MQIIQNKYELMNECLLKLIEITTLRGQYF